MEIKTKNVAIQINISSFYFHSTDIFHMFVKSTIHVLPCIQGIQF